jgi:hypothetical protein
VQALAGSFAAQVAAQQAGPAQEAQDVGPVLAVVPELLHLAAQAGTAAD